MSLLEQIQSTFEAGNIPETFFYLKNAFVQYPNEVAYYQAAAVILKELEDEEADLFEKAVADFQNFESFYNLGYHFVEVAQWEMALPFLARAFELNPTSVPIAYEFSLALCNNFLFEQAKDVLLSVEYRSDFWTSYRLYFCEILTNGDIATAKEFIRFIRQTIYEQPQQDNNDKFSLYKLDQLQAMIRRSEAIAQHEKHIRDAFFVQNGSAILEYLDFDQENFFAGGKWAIIHPSQTTIRTILEKLKQFSSELALSFKKILYYPDRNSEIIAKTAALLFKIPCLPLSSGNFQDKNTLIMAADASAFDSWKELAEKQAGQVIFALNINWLKEALICPDIAGLLTQEMIFPWNERVETDAEGNVTEQRNADERNTQIIAAEIATLKVDFAEISKNQTFPKHLAFYKQQASLLNCKVEKGFRNSFLVESPI